MVNMPEKGLSPQEATYSKIPDETISVEDFGVRATVNVWHSPTPKIKTTFERLENTDDNDLAKDELWVRMEKKRILTAKTTLLGLQAISLYLHEQSAAEDSQVETIESIIPLLPVEVETPTAEPEPEIIQPEINHEPLLIESLKPGDMLPRTKNVSELALFESFLASEIQPNGIWGEAEKWSIREPLKDLIKKFTINGAKFNGSIASVQLEVMPNPASKLLEANESKEDAKFIFSEKLPYSPSAKRIAAIKSGTIGFVATIDFTSTKGLYGTVQSELWYTKIDSRSISEVKRYMTRPVVVELHETNTETADNASPARRRWPMSDLFQSHSSRRATLR
jgi:hypothetical protein